MVVVYKESMINWNTLGRLITVDHYGLVNLVADERLATELMQDDLNGERLADELLLLLDEERNEDARATLARSGPSAWRRRRFTKSRRGRFGCFGGTKIFPRVMRSVSSTSVAGGI